MKNTCAAILAFLFVTISGFQAFSISHFSRNSLRKVSKKGMAGPTLTLEELNQQIRQLREDKDVLLRQLDELRHPTVFNGQVEWFESLKSRGTPVIVDEWLDRSSRKDDGFSGYDFCHDLHASVRIVDYVILPSSEDPYPHLVGLVHFTPKAESHRGLCHGGTMCALMDDVIGWMGFCVEGYVRPWSGFTVQVDTSLKRPVPVGSLLRLESRIDRREGERKIWITAVLTNEETKEVHAEGKGLFLLSKEIVSSAAAASDTDATSGCSA